MKIIHVYETNNLHYPKIHLIDAKHVIATNCSILRIFQNFKMD
jgi:hypothetical protein